MCENAYPINGMRGFKKIKDTEEDRSRARLLAHFEDNPESVFYSRQLEVMLEHEYFHWVTNRALRRLVQEGRLHIETRALSTGSEIKLLWHRNYRFYKRAADEVFKLVDWYTTAARTARSACRASIWCWLPSRGRDFYCLAKKRTVTAIRCGRKPATISILFSNATGLVMASRSKTPLGTSISASFWPR